MPSRDPDRGEEFVYRSALPVVMLTAVVLAVTSCGKAGQPASNTINGSPGATPGAPVQVPGTAGYLLASSTEVVYLQWQQDRSGALSGTDFDATTDGAPPDEKVDTSTTAFQGQVNDTSITIQGIENSVQGIVSGDDLTLNVVQSDGSIQSFTYHRASAADYNTALAHLQQTVQSTDAQAQQQQSQSALVSAASEATGTLQSDNANFSNARAVRDDLTKANADLAKERQDAANGNGDNCYNIQSVVDNDATSAVGGDVTGAVSDVATEQSQLTGIRGDIQAVKDAEAALKAATLPATPGVDSAVTTAQQHVSQAVTTTNKAVDALNADLNTAYDIANKAGTGACAGQGPGQAPNGPSHVS